MDTGSPRFPTSPTLVEGWAAKDLPPGVIAEHLPGVVAAAAAVAAAVGRQPPPPPPPAPPWPLGQNSLDGAREGGAGGGGLKDHDRHGGGDRVGVGGGNDGADSGTVTAMAPPSDAAALLARKGAGATYTAFVAAATAATSRPVAAGGGAATTPPPPAVGGRRQLHLLRGVAAIGGGWGSPSLAAIAAVVSAFADRFASVGVTVYVCRRLEWAHEGWVTHGWLEWVDVDVAGAYVPAEAVKG
ncbi:hypothetical protein MMPV_006691 [Pyropia vietnamensis]